MINLTYIGDFISLFSYLICSCEKFASKISKQTHVCENLQSQQIFKHTASSIGGDILTPTLNQNYVIRFHPGPKFLLRVSTIKVDHMSTEK